MDAKDAIAILTQEIGRVFYPKNQCPREVFSSLISSARKNFSGYAPYADKVQVDDEEVEVIFYCVGQNASHQFSVGLLPDGRLVVRSCGESLEVDELGIPLAEVNIKICGTAEKCDWPYVGHW